MNGIKNQPVAVPSVVWGVIVLVIAGIAWTGSVADLREVTGAGIVWTVIGIGAVLIVAAVIGALVRVSTGSTTEGSSATEGSSTTGASAKTADSTASTDRLTDQ